VKADPERPARAGEETVGVAEREGREWKGRAPGRGGGIVGDAGHAEGGLGSAIVRLDVGVADRPVIGNPVQRAKAEVVLVDAGGLGLPVERAAAGAAPP